MDANLNQRLRRSQHHRDASLIYFQWVAHLPVQAELFRTHLIIKQKLIEKSFSAFH